MKVWGDIFVLIGCGAILGALIAVFVFAAIEKGPVPYDAEATPVPYKYSMRIEDDVIVSCYRLVPGFDIECAREGSDRQQYLESTYWEEFN